VEQVHSDSLAGMDRCISQDPTRTNSKSARGEQNDNLSAIFESTCAECARPFLLLEDEGERDPELEHMERAGREFIGIADGALLCPRCLDEVERAGAERTYWRLVHL
jgi:hypothetical protein